MNATWVLCLFIVLKVSLGQSLTLQLSTTAGTRRPVLQRASIPAVTIPVARQTAPTTVTIPTISTDSNIGVVLPGTPTTVGTAGLDVLRRGTELLADRIASALGGVAVLVDVLRNTSVNGDVVWSNIGSTSQALASRLLTVGMNTANTLLQDLNGQLAVNTNPGSVLQTFLNIPNIEQLASVGSFSRSSPVSNQLFFPNQVFAAGQQSNTGGSVPVVGDALNNLAGNLNAGLPSVTTLSTSRPGLSTQMPSTPADSVTGNVSSVPQSINDEVETFLDGLGDGANVATNA